MTRITEIIRMILEIVVVGCAIIAILTIMIRIISERE